MYVSSTRSGADDETFNLLSMVAWRRWSRSGAPAARRAARTMIPTERCLVLSTADRKRLCSTCVVMERSFVRVMTTRRDIAVTLSMVATQQPLRSTSNSSFLMQNWTHLVIECFHAFAVGSISGKRLGQGRCFQPCPCVSFLQHHNVRGTNEMDLCVSRVCKTMHLDIART